MARSRDGVEVAYDVHGSSYGEGIPVVVLVHGWAGDRTYWSEQVGFLAERYQVVAVDLAGHGESGLGRADWNLPAFGADVVAVVEEIDAAEVALVGHSMGGDAITYAAAQLGDRVCGMVWVDTFRSLAVEPDSPPEAIEAFAAPFREDFEAAVDQFARGMFSPTADPELVDRIAARMARASKEMGVGSIGYALNRVRPILGALAEIKVPIVTINPDIGPTDVDSMQANGVEPIILTNVGHFLMIEDPEQFNPVLGATLARFCG
jgi:pimeloyl-ACP methyl ester carboxylesterase